MRHPHFFKHVLRGLAMVGLISVVLGHVVQQLWNHLLPQLFHFPPVTFLQAMGLAILSRLLFGQIGRPGGGPRGFGRHGHFGGPDRGMEIQGGLQGWKRYGAYWKEEGKAHYEAWLKRSEYWN